VKGICKNSPNHQKPKREMVGIKEGEKVQAKGICNIFNKIVTENSPNLEKTVPIQVQNTKSPGHQTDLTKMTYYY
jgi:hypothetical protein